MVDDFEKARCRIYEAVTVILEKPFIPRGTHASWEASKGIVSLTLSQKTPIQIGDLSSSEWCS